MTAPAAQGEALTVLREYERVLNEAWGKEEDAHAYAFGWVRQQWIAALASPVEAPQAEPPWPRKTPESATERHLRRLLCVAHGGAMAYMDDGEAQFQDPVHNIAIDFLREPVADIEAKLRALNVAKVIDAAPPPPPEQAAQPAVGALTEEQRETIQGAIDELPYRHHLIPRLVELLDFWHGGHLTVRAEAAGAWEAAVQSSEAALTTPPSQGEDAAQFLLIAMDDEGTGHPTFCKDEDAVRAALLTLMFFLREGETLDADHQEQFDANLATLLEDGSLSFEGDPGIHLYRLRAAIDASRAARKGEQ